MDGGPARRFEALAAPDGAALALLGEFRLRTGDARGAIAALEAAARSDDPLARAPRRMLLARVRSDRPAADAARADARPPTPRGSGPGARRRRGARHRAGDADGAAQDWAEAVGLASGAALVGVRGTVLQNQAAHVGRAGDAAAAAQLFGAAAVDLAALPFPHLAATARLNLGVTLLQLGRDAEAVDVLDAAAAVMRRVGDRGSERRALGWAASAALAADVPDVATRCADRLAELADAPATDAELTLVRALIAWAWGAPADVEAALSLAVVLARQSGQTRALSEALLFAAAWERARGGDGAALLAEARALPDGDAALLAWLDGSPPASAHARLLDRLRFSD
ncbi:MAG: hypothetical protein R3F59_32905 [Myxococcota bacterium]